MMQLLTATAGRIVVAVALMLALVPLAGCVGAPPGAVPYSLASYDRTYDAALGALADQKLTISRQDRLKGLIVGSAGAARIVATLEPLHDGTIRVLFEPQGEAGADPGLLKRVVDSYNERMARAKLLTTGQP